MIATKYKLSTLIAGAVVSTFCLAVEVTYAHPGHSPFSPHDITPLSKTAGQDVLVVPPDAPGRPIYSVFTGTSTFLATGEDTGGQFSFFDLTVRPNGGGPPPHTHSNLDEAFYTLTELQFLLGNETKVVEPGTFLYIPKGRRHQFLNTATTTGRLLTFTFPSGFEGFFAEEGRPIIDISNPPPPRTDFTEIAPIADKYDTKLALGAEGDTTGLRDFLLVPPDAPNRLSFAKAGSLFTSLATEEETDGNFSLFDVALTPETGSLEMNVNSEATQAFYVLDGDVTFQIGDQTTVGTPGTFVYLPQGTPYALQNRGTSQARTLLLSKTASVPEPASTVSLLILGVCGTVSILKHKQKQQTW
jgi:glyoxylate utilization-related uncharacterized protein